MKEKVFAVDIGSKLLKIVVSEEDESGKIIVLTKINKNLESFNNGEIIDPENFVEEVVNTLKEIAYQFNTSLNNFLVSFSAPYFVFQRIKGKISVNDRYVTQNDIDKCLLIAKASLASGNYEILYEEPVAYFLDGSNTKVRDPLGMEARTLEGDFFVIQALKSPILKIKDFFNKSDFKINLFLPNSLPAAFVVLPKREKELGVILVDFGYKVFNVSIFQEGKLNFYQNFNFGVSDIFEDLAIDFGLDVDEIFKYLEEIKNIDEKKQKTKIKIGRQKISYSNFVKIIDKKFYFYWKKQGINEIFKKIKENYRLPGGVYLIGGGSYIPEIGNIFKKYSGYLTKIESDIFGNLNKEERIYLNALGLIYLSQKLNIHKNFWYKIIDFFKNIFK